jgi:LPXTG-motif cell wall-anchored protein
MKENTTLAIIAGVVVALVIGTGSVLVVKRRKSQQQELNLPSPATDEMEVA